MSEPWEASLYPIIKDVLENAIDEDSLSDEEVNKLNNEICKRFHEKYVITRRSEL